MGADHCARILPVGFALGRIAKRARRAAEYGLVTPPRIRPQAEAPQPDSSAESPSTALAERQDSIA